MRPHPPVARITALARKVQRAIGQTVGDDAPAHISSMIRSTMELVEEAHLISDALLIERLQDHVPGAVGRVARAADRPLAKLARVSARDAGQCGHLRDG